MILEDNSKMPFGKYRGKEMKEIPAGYLLYLYELPTKGDRDVDRYIFNNLERIEKEAGRTAFGIIK